MESKRLRATFRVTAIYALFASLWIIFSDQILMRLLEEPEHIILIETIKGFIFILITSLLLFAALRREFLKLQRSERALRESNEQFRAVYEQSADAILLMTGKVFYDCNQAALNLFGAEDKGQIIGKRSEELSPEYQEDGRPSKETAGEVIDAVLVGKTQRFEWLHRRIDGQVFPADVAMTAITINGALVVHVTLRDLTTRKAAEELIETQLRRVAALRAVDQAIIGSQPLHVILDRLLSELVELLNVPGAAVLRLSGDGQLLNALASRGVRPAGSDVPAIPVNGSLPGRVVLERAAIHTGGVMLEPNSIPATGNDGRDAIDPRSARYFALPLTADHHTIGVLEVVQTSRTPPAADWLGFLDAMAHQASNAISRWELQQSLHSSNEELAAAYASLGIKTGELAVAYEATLAGWSKALELRDRETQGHTQRVTDLAMQMASRMGMSEQELLQVHRGALLHDIGKMGIPDSILQKPGPLTDEEWQVMRKHPVYARQMLQPIPYLDPAVEIPACHHEWWNGMGYPQGLRGDEIPLAARIFALADVWDALRSDRPYRPAWPPEKAAAYIRAGCGVQFDPQLVEEFLKLVGY
jgi:PAS domain S-box-containing protein